MMLMRTDPFRDLDRLTQQLLGTNARPSAMLMDAWRDGEQFMVEFDLPGVSPRLGRPGRGTQRAHVRAERRWTRRPSSWPPNDRGGCSAGN